VGNIISLDEFRLAKGKLVEEKKALTEKLAAFAANA
jgi:hypothetical protein